MADRYHPGDLTLTPVPGGFVVGRLLPEQGPGPWWAYLGAAPDLAAALRLARSTTGDGRAWIQTDQSWQAIHLADDFALL